MKKNILLALFCLVNMFFSCQILQAQWEECNNGLKSGKVSTFVIEDSIIFAGSRGGGVYLSTNNGESWIQKNSGIKDTCVRALAISSNNIYAGTWDGGIFRAKISDLITSVETEKDENNSLAIFPNPVLNELNIKLENEITFDNSQIKIFSGLGNEIVLPNPVINENNIQLNVSSLPQGLYYISVSSLGKVERMKFIKLVD